MAEKRMFTQKIVDSDAFLDMPLSTQALYFHLNMRADDDGFVNSPKRIQRTIGASEDDLKLLIVKRFVIGFESGVIVIKHWRMHNTLKKDRYNPTQYQDELAMLDVKDNKSYTERQYICSPDTAWQPNGNQMEPKRNHNGTIMEPQYSIGEYSTDKKSIDKRSKSDKSDSPAPPKNVRHKYGEYKNVLLSDEDMEKLKAEFPADWNARIERLSAYIAQSGKSYKNHLATIRNWAKKDREERKESDSFDTDDFFALAVERGKRLTAGEDDSIKAKAEALKQKIAEG